jgi:hypothetical protein
VVGFTKAQVDDIPTFRAQFAASAGHQQGGGFGDRGYGRGKVHDEMINGSDAFHPCPGFPWEAAKLHKRPKGAGRVQCDDPDIRPPLYQP